MTSSKKGKKGFICLLIIAIIGLFAGLVFLNSRQKTVSVERNNVVSDKNQYLSKLSECSGAANTTSGIVNTAGLTDCGGKMAVESLKLVPLKDIYYSYCREGFGVEVYGCAYPYLNKVYVCSPGSSAYERKNRYYISYSCSESQSKNTMRHELLHLVYSELSSAERARVNNALSSYRSSYESQLQIYKPAERDEELFVRVGADGRHVSDIELVDLYSKVSSTYTTQKQSYYSEQVNITDKYIDKYDGLSSGYTTICAVFVVFLIINSGVLIYTIAKNNNIGNKKNDILFAKESEPELKYFDIEDLRLASLKKQIYLMKEKPKNNTAEEFEYFKKKYGIIDIYE